MVPISQVSHTLWFARQPMGSGTVLNRAIHMLMEAQPMWLRFSEYNGMDPNSAESKIRSTETELERWNIQ